MPKEANVSMAESIAVLCFTVFVCFVHASAAFLSCDICSAAPGAKVRVGWV